MGGAAAPQEQHALDAAFIAVDCVWKISGADVLNPLSHVFGLPAADERQFLMLVISVAIR